MTSEPDFLHRTRSSYDAIAAEYADMFRSEPEANPLARAMLGAFAEYVADGSVVEVGSGPGRVTAHLHALGVDIRGIDLSPAMVALARRTFPGLRFDEGSMTALDITDGALGGLVAWYSVIHVPPARRPAVYAEFHRVLAPGGHLLMGFQVGDAPVRRTEAFGHEISLDFHRMMPEQVVPELESAGFEVRVRMVREAAANEPTPQAHLLARRPA
ncbi:class I SAM-dependent methyltransferase [Streptomyces sp. ISL-10]|uniref:class I SAM-dependent methyltransferase n=1 Tax=Streptomyces sp. ISL-10 TaxID=2819172 RepID=UPI001BE58A3D|nr:class I SAM-dependent methyltransferase [Streptomyces sp. ISL-10]MBT2366416.1 class I SAM-dependent methyltransferase [Streptomyces sp. ISL-10]